MRNGQAASLAQALVWPVQAWLLAALLADLLAGTGALPVWGMAGGFVALGVLRAALEQVAQAQLSALAEARIGAARAEIVAVEAKAAAPSGLGGPGALAALLAEKLEAASEKNAKAIAKEIRKSFVEAFEALAKATKDSEVGQSIKTLIDVLDALIH